MSSLIIIAVLIIAIFIAFAFYGIWIYNRLVRLRNMTEEAWSGIDVQLKKRYDLIPNLIKTVKAYAVHEKGLFEEITKLRSRAMAADNLKEQEAIEDALSKALGKLMVVVENYPDLKADRNFLELQRELARVEHDLQAARRYYNGTVRDYNILVEQFPSNLIAQTTGYGKREFFEIANEEERMVPDVNF